MAIPFHDAESIDEMGNAAFVRLMRVSTEPESWIGALFFINARGEPLEFVYNRVELLPTVLWNAENAAVAAIHRLLVSLCSASILVPRLVFIQESPQITGLLNTNGALSFDAPCMIVTALQGDFIDSPGTVFKWNAQPLDIAAKNLYDTLHMRGLIVEPFERAALGLREVYPEWNNQTA